MSLYKTGININTGFYNLTKTQQLQIYTWSNENIILNKNEDDDDLINVVNLNLTNDQLTTYYNMIQHNEIKAIESKIKNNEYVKKYQKKLKESMPPKEPKIKSVIPRDEIIYCKICNKSVKHYYLHTRTRGHILIEKLINDRDEAINLKNKINHEIKLKNET
jgi:hypothetical protein